MSVSKDHYYRLASDLPQERIEAATALLSELAKVDQKEDWDYALNRLIKGLTSTRQSARFGFSMALAEIIRELIYKEGYELSILDYLNLVLEASEVKSSMKGKEERAVLFGRLFGLQVLINSRLLFDKKLISKETLFKFVSSLIELSTLKSWLRETTVFTLCQFIKILINSEIGFKDEILVETLQKINDEGLNLSTEGISVYLSVPKQDRVVFCNKIRNPKPNWKNGDPFTKGNLPLLAKTLKDVEVIDPEQNEEQQGKQKKSKQKGSWTSRIPFVWDLIVENFDNIDKKDDEGKAELADSKKRKKTSNKTSKKQKTTDEYDISLKEFWKVVVDESLFSDKSSPERKYWGFEIFIKFLSSIRANQLLSIFTPNFLRCMINQSSQSSRLLNKISIKALNSIIEVSKKEFTKAPIILSSLINEPNGGCWNFDFVTKSKTVDNLITILNNQDLQKSNENEIESVLVQLKDILLNKFNECLSTQEELVENDKELFKKSNDNVLKWNLDKLLLLVRSNKNLITNKRSHMKYLEDVLKLLIKHSFFKESQSNIVSGNIRKLCQDRLNSILSDIIGSKRKNSSWSLYCVKYIEKLESTESFEGLLKFDDELKARRQEIIDLLDTIQELIKLSKQEYKKDQLYCFELLFSMVLIQFYMGDEETIQVLDELKLCYENSFDKDKEKDEEVDSSIVLTEIILSFVSRKSTLLKKFSFIVWESFLCTKDEEANKIRLNDASLKLLYDVLEARENKEGQKKLFEEEDEFEDENNDSEEENNDDDEDDEDDELEESDRDDEDEDFVDEEANGDEKDIISRVEKETNLKLAKALGIPAGESGEVKFEELDSFGEDGDDSSYESDSMDDEQMMAMDDQLSKIFKERHVALSSVSTGSKRKAEVMEAKEQMVFFKNRILDLLEIFNKAASNSYLNLTMIKPLVILINLTLDKNLGVKAHKLLKAKVSKTRIPPDQFVSNFPDKEEQIRYKKSLLDLIKWLQTQAASNKSSNQSHSLACNQSCIVIAKNLINLDPSYLEEVINLYSTTLKEWAKNPKSKVQPSLFFDFVNWLNSIRGN